MGIRARVAEPLLGLVQRPCLGVLNEVKSSQVKSSVISAHSLPPLLAAGAHSIGFRMGVCC